MKRIKRFQKLKLFGKDVVIDTSKDLHKQPWFKSDLFCERHKDIIWHAWEECGPQLEGIREINEEDS